MRNYGPRVTRYILAAGVLSWVAVSELGVALLAYDILQAVVPGLPARPAIISLMTTPEFLGAVAVAFVGSAVVGRWRYGSLASFSVAAATRVDSLLGWTIFDGPVLVGRVEHDGVGWRFEYLEGDQVSYVAQECPLCGLELIEGVLPREVVHGPNTGFEPGEENRETAAKAWADVFGSEKADDHGETLALTCPDCNFSVPGTSEVPEGLDGARAIFRRHIDRMRSGNRGGEPFEVYVASARERVGGEPRPEDVWDEYVRESEDERVLPIGILNAAGTETGTSEDRVELEVSS
ncbi:hypothetical protein [Halobaculum marinum]|uniref:Uncharacterized protein n=1 Tax=Halobaculum marinum TaxID=3031996 RepID=A0ABD5WRT9_9EURY|nr:hypothetical protein [Halobaculum sp. DT55]